MQHRMSSGYTDNTQQQPLAESVSTSSDVRGFCRPNSSGAEGVLKNAYDDMGFGIFFDPSRSD